MKEPINNCKCMNELILIGKVLPYTKDYDLSLYSNQEVEEGSLCLVNDIIDDTYTNEIITKKELYSIDYCPICGKKIEYRKLNDFKLKMAKNN